MSDGLAAANLKGVSQLAFAPGDGAHVFVALSSGGAIVRFDVATDGTLSNALTVASGLATPIGLAFHGAELFATANGAGDGHIVRLRDLDHDGVFEERTDFVRGIPVALHDADQLQIRGDALYVSIGTRSNGGIPACERVYCGVIARIADLTQTSFAPGANALPDSATFVSSAPADGLLRRYAWGFRNPFGLRLDAAGGVWVSDNGASACTTCSTCNRFAVDTPDLLYGPIPGDARGIFPPAGYPGGGGATIAPIATLGFHPAVTGFAFVPAGPEAGEVVLAEYGSTDTTLGVGRRLVRVDPTTGTSSDFLTGLSGPTDVVADVAGRLWIADLAAPAIYVLTPQGTSDVAPEDAHSGASRITAIEPNPAWSRVTIRFRVARDGPVRIVVTDVAGRALQTIFAERCSAGEHATQWDARDARGLGVPEGVYLLRMTSADGTNGRRMIRVR